MEWARVRVGVKEGKGWVKKGGWVSMWSGGVDGVGGGEGRKLGGMGEWEG